MNDLDRAVAAMLAAGLALALTACGGRTAPQAQAWIGTTTFGANVHALEVAVTVDGREWLGTYTIGSTPAFTGDVVAELVDGVLTGELIATASCVYVLTGTISIDALDAAFTPDACPDGEPGTWSAVPTGAEAVK